MEPRRSIEATGESIQEAIDKGLAALGAAPNEVIVEVLEEPSRGVFGIGARPARVRLQVLITRPPAPPPAPPAPPPAPTAQSEKTERKPREHSEHKEPREQKARAERRERRAERPPRQERAPRPPADELLEDHEDDEALPLTDAGPDVDEAELDDDVKVAREVLMQLLQKMSVRAQISVRRVETTRESGRENEAAPWLLNVTGHELNPLIGRRGETLAALQYVTRLISSRQLQHRANIIVDVDGYKSRRSQLLRGLALRMAEQAVQQKRTVALEPMPPHERRIIHLTLRDHAQVSTRSVGEGEGRKVTIVPK
ncbi:MAG: Jag N-terminal domain-containing protein [Chloroflexi bacterium]|nr:Jag N-terminal domain-containing protein [Chloroflexota bacterium]